jgi:hypothetical protein
VLEDLQLYWPKLKPNGIMAGHDYMTSDDVKAKTDQDWSVCQDGTIRPSAVKGAVNDFVASKQVQLVVTKEEWPSWITRKPAC